MNMKHLYTTAINALEGDPRGRVHGNGFMQVDVAEGVRLHIWGDPRIPAQETRTPIHDHRFGFTSYTVMGRMVNIDYKTRLGGGLRVYEAYAREGEDTELHATDEQRYIAGSNVTICMPGDHYEIEPKQFHETFVSGLTVTLMYKNDVWPGHRPRVLCPLTYEPDNDFNRNDDKHRTACSPIIDEVLCELHELRRELSE